jgi:hypothetical protein
MATRVFLGGSDTFSASSNNLNIFGAAGGTEKLLVQSGVTGFKADGNIERFEFAGNLAQYKFVVVAGTGLQIQDSTGLVVGTVPTLNQNATFAFTDGSAEVTQTGATAFSLGGATVSTAAAATMAVTLNTSDKSTVTAPVQQSSTVLVSANGSSSASSADLIFNVKSGNYTYSITGFGAGDALKFFANASINVIPDSNDTDGIQSITATDAASGTTATIILVGLSAAQDAGLFNVPSTSTVFGAGTVLMTV